MNVVHRAHLYIFPWWGKYTTCWSINKIETAMSERGMEQNNDTTGAVVYTYETQPDQPSVAIVEAVADYLGRDQTELPELLYTAINVDGMDELFAAEAASAASDLSLSFCYCGLTIEVHPDELVLKPSQADRPR
ncbi:HalOD1 output domain-containing protein [Halomarina litorea]|uniref:HalOD1 output domain-containing protein n=1 Tax=Halomarina litorea TaxID=2961595 RepID=UPI0020C1D5F1|nr:HalOD1 output domain-containing protein [Halomarina sp. BCD28]